MKQILLIKFPILFPVLYASILYLLPEFETELIFITILVLAETHFGATWPFFLINSNFKKIRDDKTKLIIFPILIILTSLVGFLLIKNTFLLIFFAANIYHVTRQSFGVCKLYCKNIKEIEFQGNLIYFFNLLFFFIGLFRFYLPIVDSENLLILNISIIALMILVFIIYILKFNFSENFLTFVTGCIIFFPICFIENPVHGIIMGVTMHYVQYLYLTHYVVNERSKNKENEPNIYKKRNFFYKFIFVVSLYSIVMSGFLLLTKFSNLSLQNLIIVPIIGQMLHFYLDSQLWKFSNEYNRENVLKYILRLVN
jgi:hypothetical protein